MQLKLMSNLTLDHARLKALPDYIIDPIFHPAIDVIAPQII